jgi:hypothetical protein
MEDSGSKKSCVASLNAVCQHAAQGSCFYAPRSSEGRTCGLGVHCMFHMAMTLVGRRSSLRRRRQQRAPLRYKTCSMLPTKSRYLVTQFYVSRQPNNHFIHHIHHCARLPIRYPNQLTTFTCKSRTCSALIEADLFEISVSDSLPCKWSTRTEIASTQTAWVPPANSLSAMTRNNR